MDTVPILLMDQQIEKLTRSRTRITTWIRGTDEHLLRLIRKSVEEERATARKYRRQIRRRLHNPRIIARIHLDNTLVSTFTTLFRRSARYGMISLTLTALFALMTFDTSSALAGTPYFFASFAVIRWNFGNSRSRYLRPFAS